jgi:O-antigen/teichoic acid export membrane protein
MEPLASDASTPAAWHRPVGVSRSGVLTSLAGGLLGQAIAIITGTILARGLGPHDRGVVAAMVLWPTVTVAIGDCGLANALAFFTAQDPRASKRYLRFAEQAAAGLSLVLIPVGLLIAYVGLMEAEVRPIYLGLVLAAVFIPAALISRFVAAIAQGLLRFRVFYALRISMALSIAVVLAIELGIGHMTVRAAVAAYLVGLTVMAVVTLVVRGSLASREVDCERAPVRALSSYGLRSVFGGLYPVETLFVDQIIVAISLGPRELGLYAAALAFTMLPRIVAAAIGTATFPHVAKAANPRRTALEFLGIGAAVLLPTGVVLTTLMHWLIVTIFGLNFAAAVVPAQLLVWGSILFGLRQISGDAIRGLGAPGRASVIEVATWPVMIGILLVASRGGLTAVAGGLIGVQAMALTGSLMLLRRALWQRDIALEQVSER